MTFDDVVQTWPDLPKRVIGAFPWLRAGGYHASRPPSQLSSTLPLVEFSTRTGLSKGTRLYFKDEIEVEVERRRATELATLPAFDKMLRSELLARRQRAWKVRWIG